MRYIATILWAVLITFVLSYVLSSMGGGSLDLVATLVMAAILSIAIFILGDGLLKEKKEQ
ncbi:MULTISPECIES: YjzD family protein [Ornithinibacillus]|uniref:YjzD family protein n=2 Tax=Ornithinibacillus TaxID=484508 RepID=A0A923L5A2_9BACI|nr:MULTISPECIES: YjzD family protein [Ornithinibacillus]MBC5636686.1 YjzD family protein [Ornithinibacillus hominis]MBS3680472.1 YjzD family protein [Ornithinibacillus massiliensis]